MTGTSLRILSRRPERHRALKIIPGVELVTADVHSPEALTAQFKDCDAVVNLVGILNESGKSASFRHVHIELVDKILAACRSNGVGRLLHMSALNADQSHGTSQYLRSKGEGANRAHTGGHPDIHVTSFRPSVIFGPGDGLFNRFADLLRLAPGVIPLACPDARFAPVFVGDVADAFVTALDDQSTWGGHYDLCGPEAFTLRELVRYTADQIGVRRFVLGLGPTASRLQARVMELMPGKPFTRDNYLSLQVDSTCESNGLEVLGIEPTSVASVVPAYLGDCGQRQKYALFRKTY